MDLAKAFDTVSYSRLIKKTKDKWYKKPFAGLVQVKLRMQETQGKNWKTLSEELEMNFEVPQGQCSGTKLFIYSI